MGRKTVSTDPMGSTQIWLPIPFVTVLVAAALAARVAASSFGTRQSRLCFAALLGLIALQAALVGLRFGYGFDQLAPLQRVMPLATGPLTYLGFRALTGPHGALSRSDLARHGGPVVLAAGLSLAIVFAYVDLLIAASFAVYITLLIRLYRRGPDALESLEMSQTRPARGWLAGVIMFLTFVALIDSAIAISFSLFGARQAVTAIAAASLVAIGVLLIALVLFQRLAEEPGIPRRAGESDADPAADREVLAALDDLMSRQEIYRDPDITLSRLGRRLGQPARALSGAVNRLLGTNIPQYVNDHRVRHAERLLTTTGRPVAEIMVESGFRTKSNFNREFRRVTGQTPAQLRAAATSDVLLNEPGS